MCACVGPGGRSHPNHLYFLPFLWKIAYFTNILEVLFMHKLGVSRAWHDIRHSYSTTFAWHGLCKSKIWNVILCIARSVRGATTAIGLGASAYVKYCHSHGVSLLVSVNMNVKLQIERRNSSCHISTLTPSIRIAFLKTCYVYANHGRQVFTPNHSFSNIWEKKLVILNMHFTNCW
jgi:hypothetical protein